MTRLLTLTLIAMLLAMPSCKDESAPAPAPAKPATPAKATEPAKAPAKAAEPAAEVIELTITGNDTMQFDKKAFEVKAGAKVKLTFKNIGKIPKVAMGHNIVILKKGVSHATFGAAIIGGQGGASIATEWLPISDPLKGQMLASTKLLGPGESVTLEFTAPTEAGAYSYLCTFPGHFAVMNGIMTVK